MSIFFIGVKETAKMCFCWRTSYGIDFKPHWHIHNIAIIFNQMGQTFHWVRSL